MVDSGKIARCALELAQCAGGEVVLKLDVEPMTPEEIRGIFDVILKHSQQFNVRIKGCRVDFSTQARLGFGRAAENASVYQGIYFVTVPELDFGQLEVVLRG